MWTKTRGFFTTTAVPRGEPICAVKPVGRSKTPPLHLFPRSGPPFSGVGYHSVSLAALPLVVPLHIYRLAPVTTPLRVSGH